ncbi:ATP-binding protein [Streptomyces sp. NPDC051920]|uniref:ATP-binding protein n=1 Tax=Streptomyces sp. NPDC051920 TaxID=3155523 RepID=UPI0034339370
MGHSPEDTGDGHVESPSPMEASLALDVDGSPLAQVRHLAASFLTTVRDAHGVAVVDATVEIAQLIVSELVTNARKYAPGPAVLRLRITGDALRIELWDSNPVPPAVRAPDPRRIGQHGLEIVTALARDVTTETAPAGKRVIATVALGGA